MVGPVLPIALPVGAGTSSSTALVASAVTGGGHQDSYYGEDERKVLSAKNLLAEFYAIRMPSVFGGRLSTYKGLFSGNGGQTPVVAGSSEKPNQIRDEFGAESIQSYYESVPSKYLVLHADSQIKRFFGLSGESADAKRCLQEIAAVLRRREAGDEYEQVKHKISDVALRRGGEELLQIFSQRRVPAADASASPLQGEKTAGAPRLPGVSTSKDSTGSSTKSGQRGGIVIAPELPRSHDELKKPYINIPPPIDIRQPAFPADTVSGVDHTGGSAVPERSLNDGIMISPPPVVPDKGDNVYRDQEYGISGSSHVRDNHKQPKMSFGDRAGLNRLVSDTSEIGDFPSDFHSPTVVYGDVKQRLEGFVNGLDDGRSVVILPHVNPDNDAIAALVAAKDTLEAISAGRNKITAYVPIEGTNPKMLEWLRSAGEDNLGLTIAPSADILDNVQGKQGAAVVVVDTADQGNTVAKGLAVDKITAIDHHSMTGTQVIADAAVYPLPALSLATGQRLAASTEQGDGYRKVAVLAGVITDTSTDMFLARNPVLSSAMIDGTTGAKVLLRDSISDSSVGYWNYPVGQKAPVDGGREGYEPMVLPGYLSGNGGYPSYLDSPLSFGSLVKLHKGLNDGTVDGGILNAKFAETIKNDPTLTYLAAPGSRELVSTIDALYHGMRVSGADAVNFFKRHIDRTFAYLDTMTAISHHRVHGSGEGAFDEYRIPKLDRRFSSSLGLLSFSRFDGANLGRPVVAVSSMNDQVNQASVLLSGPRSVEQAALLSKLIDENKMAGGHTMPIYGNVGIIRFGAKFSADKLGVFRNIVSQVAKMGAEE